MARQFRQKMVGKLRLPGREYLDDSAGLHIWPVGKDI